MIESLNNLPPVPAAQPTAPAVRPVPVKPEGKTGQAGFSEILGRELAGHEPLKFSAHAQARLFSRQITLTDQQMVKLTGAVDRAAEKGAKDSLVMVDNLALLVSIKNRTVVTAIDGSSQNGNVFTNIDSAVIA